MGKYLSLLLLVFIAISSCKDAPEEKLKEGMLSTDIVSNPHSAKGLDSATYNNLPTMDFTDTLYNFGNINDVDKVTHTFSFTNNGGTPLIISNAAGSCGCAVANYPKDPIKPGERGEIEVVFNPVDKLGHVEKSIVITTNSKVSTHQLYIKADVIKE